MKIKINLTKSAQDNATDYFERAKKARHKKIGAEATIKDLEKRLKGRELEAYEKQKNAVREVAKKEWYEKFRWFFTSAGELAIGGRDAMQNETLNSKYFEDNDLFFHADVFGASVVILKNGNSSSPETRAEVAQFAACHSRAWEQATGIADVYAMRRNQVSKSKAKGSLGTGSFLLEGEREWYKNTPLELSAFERQKSSTREVEPQIYLAINPALTRDALGITRSLSITSGNSKKSDAVKKIASFFKSDNLDYLMQALPAGKFSVGQKANTNSKSF